MKLVFNLLFVILGVHADFASVTEGDPVTLNTGVQTKQQEHIKWYFNDTRIAQINGDLSFVCTDVQCNDGTEAFIDRLKLDHQTGALTIMKTRPTDEGDYQLLINGSRDKNFIVTVNVVDDRLPPSPTPPPVSGQPIADFTACVVGSLILGGAVAVVIYFICCLINRPVESNENEPNNAIPLREESD